MTPELAAEGLARDVVRAVQDTRKAAGFDVSDRIRLDLAFVDADDAQAVASAFEVADVAGETLATEFSVRGSSGETLLGRGARRAHARSLGRVRRRGVRQRRRLHGVGAERLVPAEKLEGVRDERPREGGCRLRDAAASVRASGGCSRASSAPRRVLELLADPQRTYRVVHVTGTNGKTSTSRIIESLVRAHGLRTGLFTSPHLERFTERIMIDGEPVSDAAIADAWDEISPFVDLVDAELEAAGDAPLTFFELLTVLAFVACADAPVDVLVLEVGMGGSWDSTNTADGDVAVFAPIDIDHADRLGETIAEIASVKAGIIKDGAAVVSAKQDAAAEAVLRSAAAARDASIAFEGAEFALTDDRLAVGGQLISVRGLAGDVRRGVPAALRRASGRERRPRRSPPWSPSSAAAASRSPATSSPRA